MQKGPILAFSWQHSGFILLTATCRSTTIHRERIVAFPLQQWLRERAAMLRYTYNASLVFVMGQRTSVSFCFKVEKTATETLNS
jgi:hypothetical protein